MKAEDYVHIYFYISLNCKWKFKRKFVHVHYTWKRSRMEVMGNALAERKITNNFKATTGYEKLPLEKIFNNLYM